MNSLRYELPPTVSAEPSSGFKASDIVRLRNEAEDVPRLMLEGSEGLADVDYKVAVVLPGEKLSLDSYAALERTGYFVLEVPAEIADSPSNKIAEYLNGELQSGVVHTAERMEALQRTRYEPEPVDTGDDLNLSKEEEAEFLDFINDPANHSGGYS